jgi:virulence-associated protein VapD
MKYLIIISITILFCSCTNRQEPVEQLSKVDSLKKVAYKYTSAYLMGESFDKYLKYLNDDSVSVSSEIALSHLNYYYNLEENAVREKKGYENITYELEGDSFLPTLYVITIISDLGLHNYTTAFDDEGTIYFLFGFKHSQFDVLLKRNIKHIETIDEANQIIDLYNQLNYILDVYEIKKFERKNDSLALSKLNQPKIDGDTIVVERLYYADQLERYIKQTYRISKDLDFDVKMERLLSIDRD